MTSEIPETRMCLKTMAITRMPIPMDHPPVFWRTVQLLAWAAGMFIWCALIFQPKLGLHLLWNVLIPIAPALFVIAPGVWRNVCPLASTSLIPYHFGYSLKRSLLPNWRARLFLVSVALLMIVVPMRRVFLDTNGPALAVVLAVVGALAFTMGAVFKWKSGWCSSLCPVYPVELLYGSRPLITVPNAHCSTCLACVAPCSESTAGLTPGTAVKTKLGRAVGLVFTGCFPGFVWGWYHVPTYHGWEGLGHLDLVYGVPFAAGLTTFGGYLLLQNVMKDRKDLIASVFAASAIILYYWYRLPPVFGIEHPEAAMIADVSHLLPDWSATALRIGTVVTFGWLMVGRWKVRNAWETRPISVENSGIATEPDDLPLSNHSQSIH